MIVWDDIQIKGERKGEKKTLCPNCSHTRKKKTDPCLSVNFDKGVAHCFNCDDYSVRDDKDTSFDLPKQNYQEHTNISAKMSDWLKGRKISLETINELYVTEEKYFQPQLDKTVNNLVFNYFEGEKLINKKYRSGGKAFTQSKNAKTTFYNINSIIGKKECYIVEGEMDVLAMHEAGYKNTISVPNGANDNDKYWKHSERYLKSIEKFIIATDNDEKGIKLREDIAHRLGRFRCSFIEWSNKDANGDLIAGIIDESIKSVKAFPVKGVVTMEDLKDDYLALYDQGIPQTIKPKDKSFVEFNKIFSLLTGQLTIVTGIPSHGKSTWLEWYVLNLIKDYSFKASFFSPEHSPMELHKSNFAQKVVGKSFFGTERMTKTEAIKASEFVNNKLVMMSPEGGESPTWDWLLGSMQEQIFGNGTKIFVIDAFNKLLLPKGNRLEQINEVLTRLTAFSQSNDVLVFLVAHPTKMQLQDDGTYREPTLYDVSGSSDFRNQTHNGICVHRTFKSENTDGYTTIRNLKTKFSFQGEIGASEDFGFNVRTGRYVRNVEGQNYPFDNTPLYGEEEKDSDNLFTTINETAPF